MLTLKKTLYQFFIFWYNLNKGVFWLTNKKRVNIVNIQLVKEKSILCERRQIENPTHIYELLKDFLSYSDREKFIVVCLNAKNEPVNIHTVSIGTITASLVNPADIFKTAILSNSHKVVLAHNHPSGHPDPSENDIILTERIKKAGNILGIEVVDHIIIGGTKYYSFLEQQFLFEKLEK